MAWSDAARAAAAEARRRHATIRKVPNDRTHPGVSPYDWASKPLAPMPGRPKKNQFVSVHGMFGGGVQREYYARLLRDARKQIVFGKRGEGTMASRRGLTYVVAGRMLQAKSGRR